MRVFDEEMSGQSKKRVVFATSYEEVELIYGMVMKTLDALPDIGEFNRTRNLLRSMKKSMSVYLGKSKEKVSRESLDPCPYCKRKLRGLEAVRKHVTDVHAEVKK